MTYLRLRYFLFMSILFVCCNSSKNSKEISKNYNDIQKSEEIDGHNINLFETAASYFATSEIGIDTLGSEILFKISQSGILTEKNANSEALISVFAVKICKPLSAFDSVAFSLEGTKKAYSYNTKNLSKVAQYLSRIDFFVRFLNDHNLDSCRQMLSPSITTNTAEFGKFIKSAFLDETITNTNLAGFRFINGKYTIYVNFIYSNAIQTYQFVFLDGYESIFGINVPHGSG